MWEYFKLIFDDEKQIFNRNICDEKKSTIDIDFFSPYMSGLKICSSSSKINLKHSHIPDDWCCDFAWRCSCSNWFFVMKNKFWVQTYNVKKIEELLKNFLAFLKILVTAVIFDLAAFWIQKLHIFWSLFKCSNVQMHFKYVRTMMCVVYLFFLKSTDDVDNK
jgi:hypothetical protein